MSIKHYDLIVIGAGSGGVRAARLAAAMGKRVVIFEEYRVGGTCVIRGCVPKKLLMYGSHFAKEFDMAQAYGWKLQTKPEINWAQLIKNKDQEIDRLNQIYLQMLHKAGVEVVPTRASFIDEKTVVASDIRYTADHILIATGAWPYKPNIPGNELAITSNEAFHLDALPQSIVIVGGGYIAVEFACIFANFGSQVTLIYRGEKILRGFDGDARTAVIDAMCAKGITILNNTIINAINKKAEDLLTIEFNENQVLSCNQIMYATGRLPNTNDLNLPAANIKTDEKGAVIVDDYSMTSQSSIYAIGDVTNRLNLTPVALYEANALINTIYKAQPTKPNYANIPSAVFTQPALATVGITEDKAQQLNIDYDVYESSFRPLKLTLTQLTERVYIKMIVEKGSNKVIGVHMVGTDAPEVIQAVAVAIKAGVTKADFDNTIGIHPTSAEELVTLREARQ